MRIVGIHSNRRGITGEVSTLRRDHLRELSKMYRRTEANSIFSAIHFCIVSILLILVSAMVTHVSAQYALNGATPAGLSRGAPAGSHSLSGFESVNAFRGNLNFNLPLVSVGGRGTAGTSVSLLIERKWSVVRYVDPEFETVSNYVDYNWWNSEPEYAGATVNIRRGGQAWPVTCTSTLYGDRKMYTKVLTRLTVTMADGTEYELIDTNSGGEAKNTTYTVPNCPNFTAQYSRGSVFKTADGSGATFISDVAIADNPFLDTDPPEVSGVLLLKDGSRWGFSSGYLVWARDRNGNKVTYAYSSSGSSPVLTITDSLNRQVVVTRSVTDGTYGLCDKVTYKGFGGAARTIYITKTNLTNVLRSDQTLKTYSQLFPTLGGGGSFNPTVRSAVYLPNGQSYTFQYNSYGELARVVLPTGGAIEYDWGAGDYSTESDGGVVPTSLYLDYGIYRRVIERRVYADGSTLEHKEIYERPTEINSGEKSSVVTESRDVSNNLLAKQKSYFWGSAKASFLVTAMGYSKWRDGKEYQTDIYDLNGSTVLRSVENFFAQRASVSWWSGSSDNEPPVDPRLTDTVSTIADVSPNLISKQTFDYDQFNNQTDLWEYDFCTSTNYTSSTKSCSTSWFVRRTHTDYLTTNSVNSGDYASTSPTTSSIYIRNLPSETWVSSDSSGTTKVAKTTFEYDNYASDSNHAALVNRSSISGLDSAFTMSYLTRGNATAITRWRDLSITPTGITSYQYYDIAGNVVQTKDPRGCVTTANYSDVYGAPNGNATTNTSPSELSGVSQTSYAFATSVTNCLSQTVSSQFDFYTGMPVDGQDLNGVVTSGYSTSDPLDRPTQIIRAVGETVQNQTTFAYDDTNRKVTTTSDLASYNDNALKSESLYDGLGRSYETRRYESSTAYIKTTQTFDALGRIKRSYNPFRTTSDSTYGYAESTYDALGRVTSVETSDGSEVTTSYSENTVTVTDQAGKQRKSVTDALGRLIEVFEPDQYGTLNVDTDYTYDLLNNLTQISQGSQTRTFVYDNLSRLTSATNPESGAIAYAYDNNGNLTQKDDARGVRTAYVYDALNRVTQRNYSTPSGTPSNYSASPNVTYTYDNVTNAIGRLTKVSNSYSETHYTAFDKMGRVTAHKQRTNSIDYTTAYTYNLAGMLLEETYPSGRMVRNTVGSYGDLSQVETKTTGSYAARASNFTYSAPGAVTAMQLGNGLWESTVFNKRLQPTAIKLGTTNGGTDRLSLGYTYGTSGTNNGNILTQTIAVPSGFTATQTYTYDNLNRIATAAEVISGSTSWSQTFGYDRYGNRNITAGTGVTNLTFGATTNRITTTGYSYDAAGNTTADPSGIKGFTYDGENKQVLSTGGGWTTGIYEYDGDGKRVRKYGSSTGDNTLFVYNAAGVLVEEYTLWNNPPTVVTSYVYAGSRLLSTETASGINYLTADHLGSPRISTNGSASVVARHDYMPFGEEITSSITSQRTTGLGYQSDGVRKQFTGYERDGESGLDFAQARYYVNAHGRFSSADPLMASASPLNPQSFNRYSYVLNRPTTIVDPSGLAGCSAEHSYEQCGGDKGFSGGKFGDEVADWAKKTGGLSGEAERFMGRLISISETGYDPGLDVFVGGTELVLKYQGVSTTLSIAGWSLNEVDKAAAAFNAFVLGQQIEVRRAEAMDAISATGLGNMISVSPHGYGFTFTVTDSAAFEDFLSNSDNGFRTGLISPFHLKSSGCGVFGAGCRDYRSDVGAMGIAGSMQITYNYKDGVGFVDVDRFSPFQNSRGMFNHLFREVLFSPHGNVTSFPLRGEIERARRRYTRP